jgi:hypothetical protein
VGFIAKKVENVGNRRKTVCRYTILYAFYENLSYLLYLIITLDRFKVILPTPPYHSILPKIFPTCVRNLQRRSSYLRRGSSLFQGVICIVHHRFNHLPPNICC